MVRVEAELLQSQVTEMRGALSKGFTLLNWNSLSIPEFTDSCNKSIAKFVGVVKHIQKNASIIKGVVDAITGADLMKRTTGGRRRAGDPGEGNWDRDLPIYTQIGNAVPVDLAKAIGDHLIKKILSC